MERRVLCRQLAGAAALALAAAVPTALFAQAYPAKPVRLIIAYSIGGANDIIPRIMQPRLAEALGQAIVIENKPGAGGNIAADAVAKSAADGYTLLVTGDALAASPHLYSKSLKYDLFKDLAPVVRLAEISFSLIVNPSVTARTLSEFIALARDKPGRITYGTPGNGTSNHLATELFKGMAGINIVHVPYKGASEAINDLIVGRIDAMLMSAAVAYPQVRNGKLRALGVASSRRSALMPQTPTMAEAGLPGFEIGTFVGVLAPAGTPAEIVQRINSAFSAASRASEVEARMADLGADLAITTPAGFAKIIRDQYSMWGKVVRDHNVRLE